ncbi:MAG: 16S rRNA (cytidine(1402)-2'-O)-methyltransferase [Clostridiales bacterium]|jgi:16S rRNA (cytidine1402-2'-O)-methyltransferase|nr:16S rRNA (cytidine(1402)-2'-O)-methyltransferase [Clostridiales bacterium]
MAGNLYVVATPIGNLEDLSFRALRVLRQVEAIACEDTRQTIKLLSRYKIKKRLISYFQPKEGQKIPQIIRLLEEGKDVALVSDSGTPGISDPGFRLIREAISRELKVIPIPGPSALTAALCAAGLPTHRFLFSGFPPAKKERTKKLLKSLRDEEGTIIFYLPPRKLAEFLEAVEEILGNRSSVLARELTKMHEEFIRADVRTLREKLGRIVLKGEFTLLICGKSRKNDNPVFLD